MEDKPLKLFKDQVVTCCRDGCYYDRHGEQALNEHAATSGAAIPVLKREHGIALHPVSFVAGQELRDET